jgi:ABC-type branched-subunit amino acid transport system ATPase component
MALPRLLMLDEPSLGLALVVANIFEVISRINGNGTTILLGTEY